MRVLLCIILLSWPFLFLFSTSLNISTQLANSPSFTTDSVVQDTYPYPSTVRTLNFSGYEWFVKDNLETGEEWGPGPNWWNGSSQNVWVDAQGFLHLKIVKIGNQWHCAELWSKLSFGYGQYLFQIDPMVQSIDKNIILGLFTYYNDTQEIDIEFSKWGEINAENSQYVIQPYFNQGNMKRFNTDFNQRTTTHTFIWKNDSIEFASGFGTIKNYTQSIYSSWRYTGSDTPIPRTEKVHINLWLMNGAPPSLEQDYEVIIEKFDFRALSDADQLNNLPNKISGYPVLILALKFAAFSIVSSCIIMKNNKKLKK